MALDDLMPLAQDPKFLALSDPAKAIVLGKRDPGFAKLSPDAQTLLISKHFNKDRLQAIPAQDPTGKYRDPSQQDWNIPYAKQLLKKGGEQALRTGVPLVGAAVGEALGGPLGAAAGSGLASAGVSAMFRDRPREVLAQGVLGAVLPGPGKTAARSIIKSGAFGAISTTIDEAARTGHLPTKGQLAFNTAVSGLLGYGGYKLQPHLEEVFPKEIAKDASNALEGKASKLNPEDAREIKQLSINVKIRDAKGRYITTKGLRTGETLAQEPGYRLGPAQPWESGTGKGSSHEIIGPTGKSVGSAAFVYDPKRKLLTLDWLQGGEKFPSEKLGVTPIRQVLRQALDKYPEATHIRYERATGAAAKNLDHPDKIISAASLRGRSIKSPSTVAYELDQDAIFPEYRAPFPEKIGKPHWFTALTSQTQNPRHLAGKLEQETGLPFLSGIFTPLHKAVLSHDLEAVYQVEKELRATYKVNPNGKMDVNQALINDFINAAKGNRLNKPFLYGIQGLRKAIPGASKEITEADASRIVHSWMSAPSVSLLAGRATTAARIFSHTFQTGYMKAGRFIFTGLARAATKEGMQAAVRGGALEPRMLSVPEEILGPGRGRSIWSRVVDAGFVGIRYAVDKSRASMFGAGRAKAEYAWNTTKTWERFMDKADLDIGIPKSEVNIAKFLYEGGRKEELLDHIGRVYTESYIPGHGNMDRPFVATKHPMAMQFSNWPMFYGQTLVENFKRPPGGYTAKHAGMAARWVGANAAMTAVMTAFNGGDVKKGALRTADFTFFGPVFFAGGPILEEVPGMIHGLKGMYHGAKDYMTTDMEQGSSEFRQGAKQFGRSAPIPFKGLGKDAIDFTKWLIGGNEE